MRTAVAELVRNPDAGPIKGYPDWTIAHREGTEIGAIAGPQPRHRVAPVICHPDGSVDAVIDQARRPVTHRVGPEEGSIERPQLRQGVTAVVRHPDEIGRASCRERV